MSTQPVTASPHPIHPETPAALALMLRDALLALAETLDVDDRFNIVGPAAAVLLVGHARRRAAALSEALAPFHAHAYQRGRADGFVIAFREEVPEILWGSLSGLRGLYPPKWLRDEAAQWETWAAEQRGVRK